MTLAFQCLHKQAFYSRITGLLTSPMAPFPLTSVSMVKILLDPSCGPLSVVWLFNAVTNVEIEMNNRGGEGADEIACWAYAI